MPTRYHLETAVVGYEQESFAGTFKDWTTISDLGVEISTGDRVPNWRRAIRIHPVVTGALYANWSIYEYEPMQQDYSGRSRPNPFGEWTPFGSHSQRVLYPLTWLFPDAGSSSEKALNQALAKLTRRYRESTQACQGLVVLGELAETLQFLMSPGRGIQSVLKDYMRGVKPYVQLARNSSQYSKRTLRRATRNARDQWLETSFALRPLLNEAEQAAQWFNRNKHRLEQFYDVFKATGTGKLSATGFERQLIAGPFGANWLDKYTETSTTKFRGATAAQGSGPGAKAIGFDPASFLPSLWNLIPYSFIVDYFTNLGEVVDTWAMRDVFNAGLQQTNWTETVTEIVNIRALPQNVQTAWAEINMTASGGGEYRRRVGSVTRQRIPSLPTPVIRVRCPNTSTKWINIIALADAFYDRKKNRK